MTRAMTEQQWATAVAEQVCALEAAAIASDWSGAERCTASLAALLAAPPVANSTQTETVFRHAYQTVGHVSAAAQAAHAVMRKEFQQVATARKAVAAYG